MQQGRISQSKKLPFDIKLNVMLYAFSGLCVAWMFLFSPMSDVETANGASVTEASSPSPNPPSRMAGPLASNSTASVDNIVTDALAFYDMLSAGQKTTLQLTYTTTLARKWSNLPCGTSCRNGLQLGTNLTAAQYQAAMLVIKDALNGAANDGSDEYHQMNLAEAYLHANGGGNGYDSTLRWMAFLNTPSDTGRWMLQFGGHHYAANIAFHHGHVVGATPFFMGLEPKTFTYANRSYDPLGGERDSIRALLGSLTSAQLSTATISQSFSDCVMIPGETNNGTSVFPAVAIGQSLGSLSASQQNMALAVIRQYAGDMDSATKIAVMEGYTASIASTYVSFHGSGTSGNASSFLTAQGDYARISGPNVWIEFSCQGGIVIRNQIHYHTVWRDRSHDYGVDLSGAAIDTSTATATLTRTVFGKLAVAPNPASNEVTLTVPAPVTNGLLTVRDAAGKVLLTQDNCQGQNIKVSIRSLAKGSYLVSLTDNGHVFTAKLAKQ